MARTRKLDIKEKKKVARKIKVVPGAPRLFMAACKHLWVNKRLFGLILFTYAVLYMILVKGLATGFQLSATRESLEETLGDDLGTIGTATALFGTLVGTAGQASGEAASVYQIILFVIMSLAIIWSLRQTYDNRLKPGVRAAFYQGMFPLVPYLLVGAAIMIQLLPALIGIFVYSIVISGGIAVNVFEQIVWFMLLMLSISLSIYLTSSSVFASYIVTLSDMRPMNALRSARKLVRFRRFMIIRKVLFFPLIIGLVAVLLFVPLLLFATVVAEVGFLIFMLLLLLLAHSYFYVLYRELL